MIHNAYVHRNSLEMITSEDGNGFMEGFQRNFKCFVADRYGEAVELLKELLSTCIRSGRRGYWTVRLSMDLDHLGRKEESLQVAEKGVTDPLVRNGDLVALQRRVVRLSKPPRRWKKPSYAEALDLKFEEVIIKYPIDKHI